MPLLLSCSGRAASSQLGAAWPRRVGRRGIAPQLLSQAAAGAAARRQAQPCRCRVGGTLLALCAEQTVGVQGVQRAAGKPSDVASRTPVTAPRARARLAPQPGPTWPSPVPGASPPGGAAASGHSATSCCASCLLKLPPVPGSSQAKSP